MGGPADPGLDLPWRHQVLEIFRALKEHPPIGRNMPPVAGAVLWIRGLKERIIDPCVHSDVAF